MPPCSRMAGSRSCPGCGATSTRHSGRMELRSRGEHLPIDHRNGIAAIGHRHGRFNSLGSKKLLRRQVLPGRAAAKSDHCRHRQGNASMAVGIVVAGRGSCAGARPTVGAGAAAGSPEAAPGKWPLQGQRPRLCMNFRPGALLKIPGWRMRSLPAMA